jgi:ATP-binding cassette subfamily B protein
MLTLWVVLAGILVVIATGFLRRKLKGIHKEVAIAEGKSSGFMQETLEKLLFVQAMDISEEVEHRADDLLENRYTLQRKRKNISVMTSTCMNILSYGAAFGSLIWCANGLLAGTMTFGTLTAVSQLVGQLRTPFVNISAIMPQYVALCAAAERLMELESVGKRPKARTDGEVVYEKMEGIQAKDLSFGYDRDRIFENATFFLPKNTFGVVAGQSGIGKSTLLKLLLGVLRPESGDLVFRNGGAETPVDATTRSLFAYVPQGNLLLSGTIRENLCITRPDATEDEINQAVLASGMDAFLPTLPLGLDTVLGESGAGLSEGQAQRLSIARAVLSQAPILLLDEATSALDAETEKLVLQRLKNLPNKTCIAVTHKPAPMEQCDWILEVGESGCTLRNNK